MYKAEEEQSNANTIFTENSKKKKTGHFGQNYLL